jgi:hypothetical protein
MKLIRKFFELPDWALIVLAVILALILTYLTYKGVIPPMFD